MKRNAHILLPVLVLALLTGFYSLQVFQLSEVVLFSPIQTDLEEGSSSAQTSGAIGQGSIREDRDSLPARFSRSLQQRTIQPRLRTSFGAGSGRIATFIVTSSLLLLSVPLRATLEAQGSGALNAIAAQDSGIARFLAPRGPPSIGA